jgi:hypothetical protein
MFNIEWKSGLGYGDFVTGLAYAHNCVHKFRTDVGIRFHWSHSKDHKHSPLDPETIIQRLHAINNSMKDSSAISIEHKFNSKYKFRYINNLYPNDHLHGIWYPQTSKHNSKNVVLWRSKYNTYFPGIHKDPAYSEWDKIIDDLTKHNYNVQEVTYRTPVDQVLNLMENCCFGIGYDGMIHQLFKYFWKPCIIICQRKSLNNFLVPQATVIGSYEDLDIYQNIAQSKKRIEHFKHEHSKWISQYENFQQHRLYNTPLYR